MNEKTSVFGLLTFLKKCTLDTTKIIYPLKW